MVTFVDPVESDESACFHELFAEKSPLISNLSKDLDGCPAMQKIPLPGKNAYRTSRNYTFRPSRQSELPIVSWWKPRIHAGEERFSAPGKS